MQDDMGSPWRRDLVVAGGCGGRGCAPGDGGAEDGGAGPAQHAAQRRHRHRAAGQQLPRPRHSRYDLPHSVNLLDKWTDM